MSESALSRDLGVISSEFERESQSSFFILSLIGVNEEKGVEFFVLVLIVVLVC
jgi:hypothetical protein